MVEENLSVEDAVQKLRETVPEEVEEIEAVPEDTEESTETVLDGAEDDANLEVEEPIESEQVSGTEEAETIELEADQLAEILGLKTDQIIVDDDGIRFRGTVNGEPIDANPSDMVNAYQMEAYLTNRSKEIAKIEQEHKERLSKMAEQSNQFAQQSATILENLKDRFVNPYSKEELKALREDDPAEYAARMQETKAREEEFNQLAQQSLNTYQGMQQTQSEEIQQQYQKYLSEENEKTLKVIPNWKSVEKDVFSYAVDSGFSEQELGQIADSRLLVAFYKAMLLDKGQKGAKQKKVKARPKVMKPGNRPSKGQVSIEAAEKAKARLMETGSVADAVAALRATNRR